eukprot:TRINITY_DN5631_c0_g1_i1.p1 TRINITY_DN5631_c0_g1~~TRINITY_DN5631_c0_g1_i1.p1  ORF type:complete len:169 (+),score=52.61 TRINITY_DN5631_c0_g1_i1:39-509(+)
MKAIFLVSLIALLVATCLASTEGASDYCDCSDDKNACGCCKTIGVRKTPACLNWTLSQNSSGNTTLALSLNYSSFNIINKTFNFKSISDSITLCSKVLKLGGIKACFTAQNIDHSGAGICGCAELAVQSKIVNAEKSFGVFKLGDLTGLTCPEECA